MPGPDFIVASFEQLPQHLLPELFRVRLTRVQVRRHPRGRRVRLIRGQVRLTRHRLKTKEIGFNQTEGVKFNYQLAALYKRTKPLQETQVSKFHTSKF